MTSLTPSELDLHLQQLVEFEEDQDSQHLAKFLQLLQILLQERSNFDLIQAILYRILLLHSSSLSQGSEITSQLESLQSILSTNSQSFQNMLHLTLCLVKNLLNIPMT